MSESSSRKLSTPIAKCSELITNFVGKRPLPESIRDKDDFSFLSLDQKVPDRDYAEVNLLEDIEKYALDFSIDVNSRKPESVEREAEAEESAQSVEAAAEEERQRSIEDFNKNLDQKTRDFILLGSFKKSIQLFIKTYLDDTEAPNASLELVFRLAALFDFQIWIIKSHPTTKTNFYQCLALATDLLFLVSTTLIDNFWNYLDQRRIEFQTIIFDPTSTADRIAILEICNTLTDKYYPITSSKKTDTYKKDSFNDRFQARVRIFLTNVLSLEDNTGLNKYFSVSNIIGQDILTSIGTNGRDDALVRDILQINKLFRDPYAYVKPANHSQLQILSQTMNKVFIYLMEEEKKWYAKHPAPDQGVIPDESSEKLGEYGENNGDLESSESSDSTKADNEKLYFPEIYSLAAFDETKRGERYETLKKQDSDFFAKRFDIPQVRQTVLVQIYIICNLLHELSASRKRAFFQQIGLSGASAKHFIDDTIPELLDSLYFKIKKEMPRRYRSMDAPFSHFLTHLSITEMFWWQWLIYGKDKNGKPLFSDKMEDEDTLKEIDEKSKSILAIKEKRYFNTYATPQLTRKMKVTTGMSQLEKANTEGIDPLEERLRAQYEEAKRSLDDNDEESIQNQNIAYWKLLKRQRTGQWLKFEELAQRGGLAEKKEPEPIVTLKRSRDDSEEDKDGVKRAKLEEGNTEQEEADVEDKKEPEAELKQEEIIENEKEPNAVNEHQSEHEKEENAAGGKAQESNNVEAEQAVDMEVDSEEAKS